jgi:hypothetical protein
MPLDEGGGQRIGFTSREGLPRKEMKAAVWDGLRGA